MRSHCQRTSRTRWASVSTPSATTRSLRERASATAAVMTASWSRLVVAPATTEAVDLEGVEGKAVEVPEPALPGAEAVEGHAQAQLRGAPTGARWSGPGCA